MPARETAAPGEGAAAVQAEEEEEERLRRRRIYALRITRISVRSVSE